MKAFSLAIPLEATRPINVTIQGKAKLVESPDVKVDETLTHNSRRPMDMDEYDQPTVEQQQ